VKGPTCGALIAKIRIPDGRRPAEPDRVKALAESICEIGLLSPIIVDRHTNEDSGGDESCELVAGRHRLEACRLLGWKYVPAIDRSSAPAHEENAAPPPPERARLLNRLAEIDENLCRSELSALDMAQATAARKSIYEELHPDTKHGGDRHQVATVATCSPSFVDDTAAKTGRSTRAVRLYAQIGEAITENAAEAVRGTPVEDSPMALLDIAREKDPDKQVEMARQKAEATKQPKAKPAKAEPPASEVIAKRMLKVTEELSENDRIAFFTVLVDRYSNWLKWAR
jgi:ParB family transcriptional regulator, chromosome partitioning protein